MAIIENRPLISTEEAAYALGITPQHVRRLLRSGKLKGMRVGKTWTILIKDLEVYQAGRPTQRRLFAQRGLC